VDADPPVVVGAALPLFELELHAANPTHNITPTATTRGAMLPIGLYEAFVILVSPSI
jgi:hypothetical protein